MLVTSIQIASEQEETKAGRLQRASCYLQEIYDSGKRPCQIIFPELWGTGFFCFDNYRVEGETEQGDTFDLMSSWSRRLGAYIHTGSFVEKDGDDYYNTSLLLNPMGRIVGKYRKIHLFGFGSREKEILSPGSQIAVINTEYGKVGMCTCYDLRFPEYFRALVNLGAEYFLVASAWPLIRIEHWKLFNQTRAIENQSFVISCNGTGTIDKNQLGGHSMIVDPWGEVLSMGDAKESVIQCEIAPDKVDENRKHFPALQDRRLI